MDERPDRLKNHTALDKMKQIVNWTMRICLCCEIRIVHFVSIIAKQSVNSLNISQTLNENYFHEKNKRFLRFKKFDTVKFEYLIFILVESKQERYGEFNDSLS